MYADLESLKAYLRLQDTDETDDVELTRALQVATAEIDHLCNRSFNVTASGPPEDRPLYYATPYLERATGRWIIDVPDFSTGVGGLEILAWSATDLDWTVPVTLDAGLPYRPIDGGPANGSTWNQIVLPSGSWGGPGGDPEAVLLVKVFPGWAETPASVEQACLIQAARIHRRRDALFGIVNSLDGSSQLRLRGAVDSDVAVMLRGYIRYWAAR